MIPKSLHTVTALVNVARNLMYRDSLSPENAVKAARSILGYAADADTYGLAARAVKILKSEC